MKDEHIFGIDAFNYFGRTKICLNCGLSEAYYKATGETVDCQNPNNSASSWLGLDENEAEEFEELRIKNIGEVSQDDWQRFNDLTAKIINGMIAKNTTAPQD